jgi:uncharacterized protein (TIRG00374 family)
MTLKKLVRLSIGFVLAGLFLWLIFRHLSVTDIKSAFDKANIKLITLAIAAFFVAYSCRIERWRLMLMQENRSLSWSDCAGPLMASVAANNILPFRAGDFLRAFGYNRRLGVSAATSLTTLVVERLLDLFMLVFLLGVALSYFGIGLSKIAGASGSLLIIIGAVILFVLNFPSLFKPVAIGLCRRVAQFTPGFGEKLFTESQKVFTSLEYTSKSRMMVKLLLWSLFVWVAEGFVFWFVALSLPSIVNDGAAWLALSFGTLATIIPSTPGYVGTFDYFTSQAMATLGNSDASATVFAFLVHAVLWLPPLIVGGLYLLISPINQIKIDKTVNDQAR